MYVFWIDLLYEDYFSRMFCFLVRCKEMSGFLVVYSIYCNNYGFLRIVVGINIVKDGSYMIFVIFLEFFWF